MELFFSKGIARIFLLGLFDYPTQSYTFFFSLSHKFKRILLFAKFFISTQLTSFRWLTFVCSPKPSHSGAPFFQPPTLWLSCYAFGGFFFGLARASRALGSVAGSGSCILVVGAADLFHHPVTQQKQLPEMFSPVRFVGRDDAWGLGWAFAVNIAFITALWCGPDEMVLVFCHS